MTTRPAVPLAVLSQQLSEAIDTRRVRAAVFTTYSFDPGFFELQVLPLLFDQSFSQVDKVRHIQLEDAIGSVNHLAVYYDQSALAQRGEPAQLDYRRIDLKRRTGCFHPKLILLLVDQHADPEDEGEPDQSLIVAVMSSNLTRDGWWDNVECAHIEEIEDKDRDPSRCSFREDLVPLLRRLRDSAGAGEDHSALDLIREFLLKRTQTGRFANVSSGGSYFTRIFYGQHRLSFTQWLRELHLHWKDWNLEIISPFFDPRGAGPLEDLIDEIEPKETRVYLPRSEDGTSLVTDATYRAVAEVADWGELPSDVMDKGRSASAERLPPRYVHAKVYRFWRGGRDRRDLLIVGSANLTEAGHSHAAAGNLEAAFLVDVTDRGYPRRWWLDPVDEDPERFAGESTTEREGHKETPLDLSLSYDWASAQLSFRLRDRCPEGFEIADASGRSLLRIEKPRVGRWTRCSPQGAEEVSQLLLSTSILLVRHPPDEWRILVREENMTHRPSLLTKLSPEEILEYWALLTPEQRATFIEDRLGPEVTLEGMPLSARDRGQSRNTLFDRFAGIYHSFGCLRAHIDEAVAEGRMRDAEARLLGAKYDSLPSLLQKTLDREDGDPIVRYVTFLCAAQARDWVAKTHRDFMRERRDRAKALNDLLERLPDVRAKALPDDSKAGRDFIEWYELVFMKELAAEVGPR